MKITLEIPDRALVLTYQYVFDSPDVGSLAIEQRTLDTKAIAELGLRKMVEDEMDENA